jgi:CheY-like chemotaxis protein
MTHETKTFIEDEVTVHLPQNVVVVIVEDDEGHYLLTKNCLRNAGLSNDVVWLEDGRRALDFFFGNTLGKNRPKYLVLLDIRLPKVDGTRILEKLKNDETFEETPVIMLTTSGDQELARQCYELGCDAHVVKPPGDSLLKAIQRLKMRL